MTCGSCEKLIEKQALKVEGVKSAKIDYSSEEGIVEFDDEATNIDEILSKIEEKGYECFILDKTEESETDAQTEETETIDRTEEPKTHSCHQNGESKTKTSNVLGWVFGIFGLIIIGYFLLGMIETINLPQLSPSMGLGLLFIVGLLTGFHCVAMCGGFVVSYTTKNAQEGKSSTKSHLMYAVGKTLSYTIIGAIFGLVGSIIAFTPAMRGFAGILAGLFLIIFGLNMLNIFPALRKFRIKSPEFLNRWIGTKHTKNTQSPLIIGLLNGLMIACGPLQAIYVMAAGTGSPIEGAKLLFVFALGTLPVMLGFGYLTSFLSSKATHKILKASGILVIILGFLMLNNGLALTGSGYDAKSLSTKVSLLNSNTQIGTASAADGGGTGGITGNTAVQKEGYQEIRMDVTARGWSPDKFILKKGVPVKWIINGKQITGCNNGIQVPKYKLNFKIQSGEQTIEFTPTESGVVPWSCWMGMIQGTFVVTDDVTSQTAQNQLSAVASKPAGGSCGMGGGCGCGMGR